VTTSQSIAISLHSVLIVLTISAPLLGNRSSLHAKLLLTAIVGFLFSTPSLLLYKTDSLRCHCHSLPNRSF